MNYCVEEFEHVGLTVKLYPEEDAQFADPRQWCNTGVMLCGHRDYILGDEQVDDFSTIVTCPQCEGSGENEERFELVRYNGFGWTVIGAGTETAMQGELKHIQLEEGARVDVQPADCPRCEGDGEIELSLTAYLKQERGAKVVLPLGLIDHSGISMYIGSGEHWCDPGGWDSGQVGVIFDTPETRKETVGEDASIKDIEKALRQEVETYDQFITGDVYYYVIENEEGDTLDSCGGYLGGEWATESAKEAAEYARKEVDKEAAEAAYWLQRGVPTVV